MAANNFNNNNNGNFNIEAIKNICIKYKKYLAAGVTVVLLAVIIANSKAASGDSDTVRKEPGNSTTAVDDYTNIPPEEFEVDAYPEVNALIEEYYKYYASGDADAIEKIAFPITESEKSYIKIYSAFVDKYENIKCYTKKGIMDGEFFVTVAADMKFKDIKTAAPGQTCFYVRKNESGAYYIDNAYSQFNHSYRELSTELGINSLMTEFEQGDDYIALQKEIQADYVSAMEDAELKAMVTETLRDAISTWGAGVVMQTPEDGSAAADDTKTDDEKAGSTAVDDTKPDDAQNTAVTVEKRTAYAKTKVNMREKRSIKSESLEILDPGQELTVYGESKKGWLKVKVNGKVGFVKEEYIVSDKSEVEKPQTTKRTAYAKTTVNMRKKRSTDSDVLVTLKPGTKVTIYGKSTDGWFKIKAKGKTGYVKKEYIVSDKSKVEKEDESGQGTNTPATSSPSYYNEGERITLTQSINIRQSMSESAERVALAYQGDVVTVVMSYAEGWTKVSYNGQTGYVKTEVLR